MKTLGYQQQQLYENMGKLMQGSSLHWEDKVETLLMLFAWSINNMTTTEEQKAIVINDFMEELCLLVLTGKKIPNGE